MVIYVVLISSSAFLLDWSYKVIERNQESIVESSIVIETAGNSLFQDGITYGITSFTDGSIQIFLAIVISSL